jgi:hypothetical protein
MHTSNIAEMQYSRYTRDMSEALGLYLKTMREAQDLKPSQVLAQLSERLGKKIAWSRLSRTEKGEFTQWPDGDYLTALYDIVRADLDDVAWIQRNPSAKATSGEDLANKRIARRAKAIAEQVPEEKVPITLDFVRQLRSDPVALRELRELIAESGDAQQH